MNKIALICLLTLTSVGCTRLPSGTFGTAGAGSGVPVIVDGRANIQAERDLRRLKSIDASIQASLARLDAALDPNSPPANLEKLVIGDELDPALRNSRPLVQQSQIEQKFDEKNQALINDELTGNLASAEENIASNPEQANSRSAQQRADVDANLDNKVQAIASDLSLTHEEDVATRDNAETETQTPDASDSSDSTPSSETSL